MVAEMSVASGAQEQELQCVQQSENGATTNGGEVGDDGGSPKSSSSSPLQTPSTTTTLSPSKAGIELIFGPNGEVLTQPSSPPHNYRHSRAYRHFKNPPQPHMCIRVSTAAGEEVFINVLSWTRIVVPQEPTDPIPLYGGMKVPPGSPRCPPLVYAVMANPEVLKDSGRHSKDPEERRAMIELMCDFVEAMNPDLKLNRNAVILKDRDISGELKDVWNAVQAQRDREREEQMLQQQSHAPPPQQMYLPHKQDTSQVNLQNSIDSVDASDNNIVYGEFGPETAVAQDPTSKSPNHSTQHNSNDDTNPPTNSVTQSAISHNSNTKKNNSVNDAQNETSVVVAVDQIDSINLLQNGAKTQQLDNNSATNTGLSGKQKKNTSPTNGTTHSVATALQSSASANPSTDRPIHEGTSPATSPVSPTTASPSTPSSAVITTTSSSSSSASTTTTTTTTTTTKKEKLGGFLPNSCIFPRFKNKNKDKNKEKDKEKEKDKSSNHPKERTLLNSLKKTTTAATNAFSSSKSSEKQAHNNDSESMSKTVKNCLNLEAEVEKLDLNKIDATRANDVLIKVATPAAK